jgi:hypothetical protein
MLGSILLLIVCAAGWARSWAKADGLRLDALAWRDTAWSNYRCGVELRDQSLALDTSRGRDIAAALNVTLGAQALACDLTETATRAILKVSS